MAADGRADSSPPSRTDVHADGTPRHDTLWSLNRLIDSRGCIDAGLDTPGTLHRHVWRAIEPSCTVRETEWERPISYSILSMWYLASNHIAPCVFDVRKTPHPPRTRIATECGIVSKASKSANASRTGSACFLSEAERGYFDSSSSWNIKSTASEKWV